MHSSNVDVRHMGYSLTLLMFIVLDYVLGLIKGKVHKRLKKWVYWFGEGECNIYSINSSVVCLIA
jgi:phage-related holin